MTTEHDTTEQGGTVQEGHTMATDTRHDEPRTLAVPRMHQIGGVTLFLGRTGALILDEREGRRPLVRLTPREAHAVLTFLRLPGVAELIEREEAERQAQTWRDFEEDPEYSGEWEAA